MARQKSKKYTGVYFQELQNGDKSYYITYKENKKDIYTIINNNNNKIKKDRRNKYGKK